MWVVLVRHTKFGKEVRCHRHYFERKSDAESFAKTQHRRVEIYKAEMAEE